MNGLLQEIADTVSRVSPRVVMVSDPDGLLATPAARNQLEGAIGFPVVQAEGLPLRIHYELNIKPNPTSRVCYVTSGTKPLLWDMARNSQRVNISIGDFLPNFTDRQTLKTLDLETLGRLHDMRLQGRVSAERLQHILSEKSEVAEPPQISPLEALKESADTPQWTSTEYVENLGKAFKDVLAQNKYNADVAETISDINFDFQHYLHDSYFATLNSSGGPKDVHAVAPYIQERYGSNDKVAFIVVDGMAWWQWEVLRDELEKQKLLGLPEVKSILAWLPSITALSRQALFRGSAPTLDYRQAPAEEEKLWKNLWKGNPIFSPVYQHNLLSHEELNLDTQRLAVVDVQLDKKMHTCTYYSDLFDLTQNWAERFVPIIARLKKEGFKIVLTTDHGNVLAKGIRNLTPQEKAHLFLSNSRGERFVYFNSKELADDFRDKNYMLRMFSNPRENWFAFGDEGSFSTPKKQLITHGGSHFMETVIPLIIF